MGQIAIRVSWALNRRTRYILSRTQRCFKDMKFNSFYKKERLKSNMLDELKVNFFFDRSSSMYRRNILRKGRVKSIKIVFQTDITEELKRLRNASSLSWEGKRIKRERNRGREIRGEKQKKNEKGETTTKEKTSHTTTTPIAYQQPFCSYHSSTPSAYDVSGTISIGNREVTHPLAGQMHIHQPHSFPIASAATPVCLVRKMSMEP